MRIAAIAIAAAMAVSLPALMVAAPADARGGKTEAGAEHGHHQGPDRAARHTAMVDRMFERLDADGDGRITVEELRAARMEVFERADTDGDGVLSVEEYTAHLETMRMERMAERMARRLARYDADGDGQVTAEEFAAAQDHWFQRFDRDGTGSISREDLEQRRHGHRGPRGPRGGDRPGPSAD